MEQPQQAKRKICVVVPVQYTVEVFLLHHLAAMARVYDVTVVLNPDDPSFLKKRGIPAEVIVAPVQRQIDFWADVRSLAFLIRLFRKRRFDLVHSMTPKAGLLAMLSARIAGVHVRVHTFTGQVWSHRSGPMHRMLKAADRVTAWAATHVLVDSFTQRAFLVDQGVIVPGKSGVLANGSLNGVDVERFKPDLARRTEIRNRFGIAHDTILFLYMARLTRDKGALVMAEGFAEFCRSHATDARLLVVGPDEERLRPRMIEICGQFADRMQFADYTLVPEQFLAAADVFCLPSFREGFGSVLINAAAVGIPAIASRIYGSEEAIQEGVTGLLHGAGDARQLAAKMYELYSDAALRLRLGRAGRERARRDFSEQFVTAALLRFYGELVSAASDSRRGACRDDLPL